MSSSSHNDPVHAALKTAIEVPTHRYLWTPSDGIDFVPRVCSKVFGDGLALLALTTINSRPRFYIIRIDSSWHVEDSAAPDSAPDLRDHLDDIYAALEIDFGAARWADDEEVREEAPERAEKLREWPAFDDEIGTSWSRIDWPELEGFAFHAHPFARGFNILAEVHHGSAA